MPVPDIPLPEQRAIADYLDAETARIDALITKKQQLINLLEERFSADTERHFVGREMLPLKRLVHWKEGPESWQLTSGTKVCRSFASPV